MMHGQPNVKFRQIAYYLNIKIWLRSLAIRCISDNIIKNEMSLIYLYYA